jgi:glycosyltransferase involved in cell wall biosynthesis
VRRSAARSDVAAIKTLCITEDPDRPTTATFVGLKRAGVDVTVVCPPNAAKSRATLAEAGVPVIELQVRGRFDRAGTQRLRDELVRGNYDVLHVFSNRPLESGIVATRGLPVRLVAYRGIVGNVSFFSPMSWLRFLNPRIDRIVCVCNAVRDYFLSMQPAFLRMPVGRPVTIYKGHNLDWYTAKPGNLSAVGIPAGAFVVVCVANYRPRKGIEVLVDALAELPQEWPVHLLLVGRMDAPRLHARIAASPVRERIHVPGHRDDAPALVAACDVFALPSVKREGLARSLIEAMAYAVAPVVSDCGGSPEVVVDGRCGIVVPVRDAPALARAIARLYENPELRTQFGAAARARIANDFRIERTIEQTLALYRELVERSGGETR